MPAGSKRKCPRGARGARKFPECGFEFPTPPEHTKSCHECPAVNPSSAHTCHASGSALAHDFVLTLDEALRTGMILRDMERQESEVQEGERIVAVARARVLRNGNQRLVKIIQTFPDESWARLRTICLQSEA